MFSKGRIAKLLVVSFTLLLVFSLAGLAQDSDDQTTLKTQVIAHCGGPGWHVHGWYVGEPCATLKEPVYETLIKQRYDREDQSWSLVPGLAKEWSPSEDYTTWTFELREGVTWHDGEKFTAEDVKYTMDMYFHPEAMGVYGPPVANALEGYDAYKNGEADSIEGVEIVDNYTVKFHLTAPKPTIDQNLRYIPIVPAHRFKDVPMEEIPTSEKWEEPVGTGSFKFVRSVPEELTVMEKNEDYYLGEPNIDRWVEYHTNSPEAKLSRLKTGELHGTRFAGRAVDPGMAEQIASLGNYQVEIDSTYLSGIIGLQPKTEVFQDVRVRRAILHAIDREEVREVLPYTLPHDVFGIGENESDVPRTYDTNPEKARQLLEEANFDQEEPFNFSTHYQGSGIRKGMLLIAEQLENVGIDVEFRQVDTPTWQRGWYETGEIDIVFDALLLKPPFAGWTEWIRQDQIEAGTNPGYFLPEIDRLEDAAVQLPPGEERQSLIEAAQIIMNEKAWIVPLVLRSEAFVMSDDLDTGGGLLGNHGIHIGRDWRFYEWSLDG